MTPTEALVQAARAWSRNPHGGPEWRGLMRAVDEYEHAEAFREQRSGPDDVTVTVGGLATALHDLDRETLKDFSWAHGSPTDHTWLDLAAAILAALSADKEGQK